MRAFLEVPPATAEAALTTFIELDALVKAAFVHRLRWLGERGTPAQRQQFITQIARANEPLNFENEKTLADHKALQPWIDEAIVNLLWAHDRTMEHLVGERNLAPSGPVSSGGGHTVAAWEKLADDRIQSWPADVRAAFEAHVDKIDIAGAGYEFFLGFLTEAGFDVSRKGWARHLAMEQHLWGIEQRVNKVLCLWLPRPMFNVTAWKATLQAARYGKAPVGGKSLFPVSWSHEKIRAAGKAILEDPKTQVLTENITPEKPAYYLRGTYDGVSVDVGLVAGRVHTLFPAWRQQLPATVGRAYLEWWDAYSRARDTASFINRQQYLSVDLRSPIPLALTYLSREVDGLGPEDGKVLASWLDPKLLPDAPIPTQARSHQAIVFNWLSRERIVYRLEGQMGHLFHKDNMASGQ
ncbi:MAG: EndoU domain-containing protein [Bdellovibrionota bacterium]